MIRNTYLQRPPIVNIQCNLNILRTILRIEIDSPIVNENIDFAFSAYFTGEGLNTIAVGDIQLWEHNVVGLQAYVFAPPRSRKQQ